MRALSRRAYGDGHIAIIALDQHAVVLTSDPQDIARWGVPKANIITC